MKRFPEDDRNPSRAARAASADDAGDAPEAVPSAEERRRLRAVDRLLAASRVEVRPGFTDDVMASLPSAGWEARSPRSWPWAVAVMLAFGVAASALLGLSSEALAPGASVLGALGAVGEAFAAALLAGSGMLWASWRGFGLVLDQVFSPSALIALAVLVVSLDVLLLSLVARGDRATADAGSADAGRGGSPSGR